MAISFKGAHFPEVILMGVRWYVASLLLDSRVVDVPRSSHRMVVTLSSVKPFFFHGLNKTVPCSDAVAASDPGIPEERHSLARGARADLHRSPACSIREPSIRIWTI